MIAFKTRIYPTPTAQRFLQRQFSYLQCEADCYARSILSDKPEQLAKYIDRYSCVEQRRLNVSPGDIDYVFEGLSRQAKARIDKQWKKKKEIYPLFFHGKRSFLLHRIERGAVLFRFVDETLELFSMVKIKATRPSRFPGEPVQCCIIEKDNQYWVSLIYDLEMPAFPKTHTSCGVDLGMKTLATVATNKGGSYKLRVPYCVTKKQFNRLKHYQHMLSRKNHEGPLSNREKRLRLKMHQIYKHAFDRKNTWFHMTAKDLLKRFDFIGLEDLDIKKMMKNRILAKNYFFLPFYGLSNVLRAKNAYAGKLIRQVSRYFPSSKLCFYCGAKSEITTDLSVREWTCPHCHRLLDRDVNAARNILRQSLRDARKTKGKEGRPIQSSGAKTPNKA